MTPGEQLSWSNGIKEGRREERDAIVAWLLLVPGPARDVAAAVERGEHLGSMRPIEVTAGASISTYDPAEPRQGKVTIVGLGTGPVKGEPSR